MNLLPTIIVFFKKVFVCLLISAKEVMFLPLPVDMFVSRITQKLLLNVVKLDIFVWIHIQECFVTFFNTVGLCFFTLIPISEGIIHES